MGGSVPRTDDSDPPTSIENPPSPDEPITRRDLHKILTERHDKHRDGSESESPPSLGAHIDKKTKHWASAITNVQKIIGGVIAISTALFFSGRWAVTEIKDALRQNADALAERIDPAVMRPSKEEEDRRKKTGEAMPLTLTEQLSEIKKIQKTQIADEGRISKLEDHDAANVNGEVGKRLDKVDEQLHVVFGKKNNNPMPVSPVGPTARQQGLQ